ncbi:carboxymuconolactone decarboxylase family protein [Chitinophaga nivalis]|uniref:Carboxymuconolactone decarboxylase family protein n=1 Tax=Chitinophaga nivalis TaxID=2991709 RepID=A0ABT3IKN0_9BACT|nr:hypothetical protein [Chitinophaga nivalis]MCW3465980.1 hypothetical protein [Chitinophaga nivalis]MCW3484329.1 hypothetical protein [Chitinophaga nivalis]
MARINPLPISETTEATQTAFEHHKKQYHARITNMKATLGHSLLAFEVYMQWYPLYISTQEILGERLAYLFAYAVSVGSNCPLCTTFFRKIIIDNGEQPEQITFTAHEQLLLDFGGAISAGKGHISDTLFDEVKQHYNTAQLVTLIAFAGQMIATNVFSNVIETDIDDYLLSYLPPFSNK